MSSEAKARPTLIGMDANRNGADSMREQAVTTARHWSGDFGWDTELSIVLRVIIELLT